MNLKDLENVPHPPNSYWHGGGAIFAAFDHRYWGTGEAQALGAGHYLAAQPAGGEYFARYAHFQKGTGFLYRVAFDRARLSAWNYDRDFRAQPDEVRRALSQVFGPRDLCVGLRASFDSLRREMGAAGAVRALLEVGINAIYTEDEHKPGHGHTLVVLDDTLLRPTAVWQLGPHASLTPRNLPAK